MARLIGTTLLFLSTILVLHFEGSSAQCTANLTNKVVREGDLNTLQLCNTPNFIQWQILASSDVISITRNITNYDNVITPGLSGAYAVDNTGLTILNATTTPSGSTPISTSGLYLAKYIKGGTNYTAGAKLVVLRQGPICSCNSTSNQLTCGAVYADNNGIAPIRPIYTWTLNGQVISTTQPLQSSNDAYTYKSSSTITVNPNNPGSYQCQLTFSAPTFTANTLRYNISTNAPDFNESCDAQLCFLTTSRAITTTILTTSAKSTPTPTKSTLGVTTTTQKSTTPTKPPVTTTQSPTTSTKPQVTTTQSPTTSTKPGVTTTQPPTTSTKPPVTTTQSPTTSTKSTLVYLTTTTESLTTAVPTTTAATTESQTKYTQQQITSTPINAESTTTTTIMPSLITSATGTTGSETIFVTLEVVLIVAFAGLFCTFLVCFCWCLCCWYFPYGTKSTSLVYFPRNLRYRRVPFRRRRSIDSISIDSI